MRLKSHWFGAMPLKTVFLPFYYLAPSTLSPSCVKKPFSDAPDFDDLEDRPSRTEQKKAMARLQQLGERLAALPLETIQSAAGQ